MQPLAISHTLWSRLLYWRMRMHVSRLALYVLLVTSKKGQQHKVLSMKIAMKEGYEAKIGTAIRRDHM